MNSWLELYVLLAGLACAIALPLTGLLVRFAPALGLVDEPGAEKFHQRATPVGGGLAIFLALLPVLAFAQTRYPVTYVMLGGSGFLALVGLVDDLRGVAATLKFALLIALTAVLWNFQLGAHPSGIAALDFLLTALWIAGVSSAFNAIDNMDGLATGVATIAGVVFVVIAIETRQWTLGALSAALVGATVGFLFWNFHPARIFMGDTGSLFLGFYLASLGLLGEWNSNPIIAAIIPILVLGLPIFDLGYTVLRRHQSGVTRTVLDAIRHCDTDHISHRLVRLGLGVRGAVGLLYLLAASFGISALSLRVARSVDAVLHLFQALVIVAALVPLLNLSERPAPTLPDAAKGATTPRWLPLLLTLVGLAIASILMR